MGRHKKNEGGMGEWGGREEGRSKEGREGGKKRRRKGRREYALVRPSGARACRPGGGGGCARRR